MSPASMPLRMRAGFNPYQGDCVFEPLHETGASARYYSTDLILGLALWSELYHSVACPPRGKTLPQEVSNADLYSQP